MRRLKFLLPALALAALSACSSSSKSSSSSSGSSGTSGSSATTGSSGTSGGAVHPVALAVSPSVASIAAGTTQQFHAQMVESDGTVADVTGQATWETSNHATATMDSTTKGLAHGAAAGGPVNVTASFNGFSGTGALTVTTAKLVRIEVTAPSVSIPVGTSETLTATGIFSDTSRQDLSSQVTWSSTSGDGGSAASVDDSANKGQVTGNAPGQATITATDATSDISGSLQLAVTAAQLTGLAINGTLHAPVGHDSTLSAIATYSDHSSHDVSSLAGWTSSDQTIATVVNGVVHGVAAGQVTLTAQLDNQTANATFTVDAATLVSIAVVPQALGGTTLAKGTTGALRAMGTFSDHNTVDITEQVDWTSDDSTIVAVDSTSGTKGALQALKAGSTTIHATDPATSIAGSAQVTVTAASLSSITVTASAPSVPSGSTVQFTATGHFSDGTTQDLTSSVTWTSSDDSTVLVSNAAGSQGLANTSGTGTGITITATDAVSGKSGTVQVDVTAAVLTKIEIAPQVTTVAKGYSVTLHATGTYSNGNPTDISESLTWESSDPTTASVQNTSPGRGQVQGLLVGQVTITATDPTTLVSATATVNVSSAILVSIAIAQDGSTIHKGVSGLLTATGTFSDTSTQDLTTACNWASDDAGVLAVYDTPVHGAFLAVDTGSAKVTATEPVSGIVGTATINVDAAVLQSITITPDNASQPKGSAQDFTAWGTYSDQSKVDLSGQVSWSSSAVGVAAFDITGKPYEASTYQQGTATVTATDPSTQLSGSANLTVTQPALVSLAFVPNQWTFGMPGASSDEFPSGGYVAGPFIGTYTDSSTVDFTASSISIVWNDPSNVCSPSFYQDLGNDRYVFPCSNTSRTTSQRATMTFTDNVSGIAGTYTLTVDPAEMTSIYLTPSPLTVAPDSGAQLTAMGNGTDGMTYDVTSEVSWTSSDPTILTVGDDADAGTKGYVTAIASSGSATTVTASTVTQTYSGVQTASEVVGICPAGLSYADGQCGFLADLDGWNWGNECYGWNDRGQYAYYAVMYGYRSGFTWTDSSPSTPTALKLHVNFGGYVTYTGSFDVTLNGAAAGTFTYPSTNSCTNAQVIEDIDLTPYLASYVVGGTNQVQLKPQVASGTNYGVNLLPNSSYYAIAVPTY